MTGHKTTGALRFSFSVTIVSKSCDKRLKSFVISDEDYTTRGLGRKARSPPIRGRQVKRNEKMATQEHGHRIMKVALAAAWRKSIHAEAQSTWAARGNPN